MLPGLEAVGEAASIELSVYISLKTSVVHYVAKKEIIALVQYLNKAILKTKDSKPAALWSQDPAAREVVLL